MPEVVLPVATYLLSQAEDVDAIPSGHIERIAAGLDSMIIDPMAMFAYDLPHEPIPAAHFENQWDTLLGTLYDTDVARIGGVDVESDGTYLVRGRRAFELPMYVRVHLAVSVWWE